MKTVAGGVAPAKRCLVATLLAAASVAGCTVYQTAPGYYVPAAAPPVASFDRSWDAARSAFSDQGVRITSENRDAGVIRGTRDGIDVSATVRTLADGSVQVAFNTAGATARDPGLIDRVSRAYDRYMGR